MDSTIIIPVFRQPHLLAQAIDGIRRYSMFAHRIVVAYADGRRLGYESDCADWAVNAEGRAVRVVDSVAEVISQTGCVAVDCTDALKHGPPVNWLTRSPAAEAVAKCNLALAIVDTDWVCPSWDADYYPLPRWDEYLAAAIAARDGHGVFVPRFVEVPARPVITDGLPPYPATYPEWHGHLTHAELAAIPEGDDALHTTAEWANTAVSINPQWWPTRLLGGSVPYPPDGGTPEWELSKKVQRLGLQRVMHCRSRILHKYSVV